MLKVALEKLGGATMRSLPVAVKPGQHVAFALLGEQRVPAFELPGNPVAALIAYKLYVRPALRAMAQANALALLPDGDRAGGRVDVLLLDTEGLGPDGAITPA